MKRGILIAGLLAASLAGCERKADEISKYDPALDGPVMPVSPVLASPLLDGKSAGSASDASVKVEKPTATAPVENPAADTAKTEIDGRMDLIHQMITAGKYEDYERASLVPDEMTAKLTETPTFLQSSVDADRGKPEDTLKSFDDIAAMLKGQKPDVSVDGNLATYKDKDGGPFVMKKVDGAWYPSDVETKKAKKPSNP